MTMILRLLALAATFSCVAQARGAELECPKAPEPGAAEAVLVTIMAKRLKTCYDLATYTPPSLDTVKKMLDLANKAAAAAERKQAVAGLLEATREWMATALNDPELRNELRNKVSEARAALTASEASNDVLNPTSWRINEGSGGLAMTSKVFDRTDFTGPVRGKCSAQVDSRDACATAIADLEGVLRGHSVVEVALVVVRKDEFSDLTDLFSKRARMWDAYRTEARPQYPWEWLLNGALYRDDRPKDEAGNPKGPANLPKGQVIFLHPGVGLEQFNARGTDRSSNNPTLYMEWLGYNRLQWSYEEGKLRGGLGVSIVGVYAPRQDASDWSHGLIFWMANKYGLAVTRNSGGTSVMVSMDLGELYRDKLNQINGSLRSSLSSK